jgi:radical SAM protein with 4Fe4S-binding SPASM domain
VTTSLDPTPNACIEPGDGTGPLAPSLPWISPPVHVDFNITNACNLACRHCHAASGRKLPDELSTNEAHAVIAELHRAGIMSLVIAGGEPFARRDAIDLLAHACSLPGWEVSVVTNGLFLRGDAAKTLAERCPGLSVNVSIDGSNPALFGLLRRRAGRRGRDPSPLFRDVCDGVRRSIAAGLQTSVNFTITRATLDDTLATYALVVDDLGAHGMVAIKFFPAGYGKDHLEMMELPYAVWASWFVELSALKIRGDLPKMQVSVPAAWEFYLPLIEAGVDIYEAESAWGYAAPLREPSYRRRSEIGDASGVREIAVAPNGDVYPTVLVMGSPLAVCGNLRRERLAEILVRSETLRRLRRLTRRSLVADCRSCALVSLCGGGSRARAWDATQLWAGADVSCPMVHGANVAQEISDDEPLADGAAAASAEYRSVIAKGGDGPFRVIRHASGAEVRVRGRILHCDEATATVLDACLRDSDAVADAAADSETLRAFRRAGVDLTNISVSKS